MTRDEARACFAESLTYDDLTRKSVQRLRNIISAKMVASGLIQDSYCCQKTVTYRADPSKFFAGVKCNAFYFKGREAVSFNRDGFIGFAGWADSTNIQPVLEGFSDWVKEMSQLKQELKALQHT